MRDIRDAEKAIQGHFTARRESRKLANNTYLERRGDAIAVRLHFTDVITFNPDGSVTLNSGGWRTVTTKDRMNFTSGVRVFQHAHEWYVAVARETDDGLRYDWDSSIDYFDGITFKDGRVLEGRKKTNV